jgi:hypothetical protein
MKGQATETETAGRAAAASSARTNQSRRAGERVSISPLLSDSVRPLLAGLGIEVLEPDARDDATLRIESAVAGGHESAVTGKIRIEHVRAGARQPDRTLEFEPPGLLPGASYVISYAFGINPPLLTADAAMLAVIRAAVRAGQVDSPMLVSGETGTGKELLVRLIHAASDRAGKINCVNCAALNESVLPSRTGPSRTGLGDVSNESASRNPTDEVRLRNLCAAADTTLFLDQVSELSPAAQTWVLHVLSRRNPGQGKQIGRAACLRDESAARADGPERRVQTRTLRSNRDSNAGRAASAPAPRRHSDARQRVSQC